MFIYFFFMVFSSLEWGFSFVVIVGLRVGRF